MAQGNVEIWLGKLLDMSLRSVHAVICNAIVAISDPNFELLDFLNTYPAQVSCVVALYMCIFQLTYLTCEKFILLSFYVDWFVGDTSDLDQ